MEIATDSIEGNCIKSYHPGQVTVSGKTLSDNLILTPKHVISDCLPLAIKALKLSDLQVIFDLSPDIAILGAGDSHQIISGEMIAAFAEKKIGLEVMDNFAACRTYNVLASEKRNVLLALLPHP